MTAADRDVRTLVLPATPAEMEEELAKHPVQLDDRHWTYEVEADGLTFFENGVLVERWVQR